MKLKAAAILGLFSSSVYASYPSGLVYVYALGAATYLIPLIAPLFFLPPTDKTFRAYLLLLVLWYGAGGVAGAVLSPLMVASFISDFGGAVIPIATTVLSFAASILALKRYGHAFVRFGREIT